MKIRSIILALVFAMLAFTSLDAQSPTPILLQAVAPGSLTPTPAPAINRTAADSAKEMQNVMQLLQQMLDTNADTIKRQQAALETLDALQKAAEEIKIYSKRG